MSDLEERPDRPRVVTIRDVAAASGVSIGTVSKVLNGRGKLRAETRARVSAVADRLGFRPNPLAQGLLAGRTHTIGLIACDGFSRFSVPVMLGIEDLLASGEISVFTCDTRDDPIRERHHVERLLARRVEGIVTTGRRAETRHGLGDLPVPVVHTVSRSAGPGDFSVVPDDRGGGALAVRHLLAAGRGRIGHITGPRRFLAAVQRAAGLTGALAEAGLRPVAEPLFGEWSEEWGRQAAGILLRARPDVDAVVCGSDQIARGVAEAMGEHGRKVPDDVALIGFENWEPMALGARPPLTSVDLNLTEIGRTAARYLLDAIGGAPPQGGVLTVPATLVVRESTR
ncbi:LacI family DNA-binding transcriptional regulator [Spongiactinospora sp. 9N601]|uniref:LacI family DNA-binding transcriptional regulator n=1 Tax=Spongiactinospora sp. 9N601 TaxID=3375149 RepID=UPI0037891E44